MAIVTRGVDLISLRPPSCLSFVFNFRLVVLQRTEALKFNPVGGLLV